MSDTGELRRRRPEYLLKPSHIRYAFSAASGGQYPDRRPSDKSNQRKKAARDKSSNKHNTKTWTQTPALWIQGNASSFRVYATIRQSVLQQAVSELVQFAAWAASAASKSADQGGSQVAAVATSQQLPKVVSIGLSGVFQIVRETSGTYPEVCQRALVALLNLLQGLPLESLRTEPCDWAEALFRLLLDLAEQADDDASGWSGSSGISSLASAALLSFAVARGDTGKLLEAVAHTLLSPGAASAQPMQVPDILTRLQHSAQAVLLHRSHLPTWFFVGIKKDAVVEKVRLAEHLGEVLQCQDNNSAMACDGKYLYLHCAGDRLLKIGTGYGGTVVGRIYCQQRLIDMLPEPAGSKHKPWLACAEDRLLYMNWGAGQQDRATVLISLNKTTLEQEDSVELRGKLLQGLLFSDGKHLGQLLADDEDNFVVHTLSGIMSSAPTVASQMQLKLSLKSLKVGGCTPFDTRNEVHTVDLSCDEDIQDVQCGKDFAVVLTVSGRLYYAGKAGSLGLKTLLPPPQQVQPDGGTTMAVPPSAQHSAPAESDWREWPAATKMGKIVQVAAGHEGLHALLLAADGTVWFVGTARRGEDGEAAAVKQHKRIAKPGKPRKLVRLEGHAVVKVAANSGSSACVTRNGSLYIFGKDAFHCDATGLMGGVQHVVDVALGKAHGAIINANGEVLTFGVNNKGQCGRDCPATTSSREVNMAATLDGTASPFAVQADDRSMRDVIAGTALCIEHNFRTEDCMVCTVCGECTGYGAGCVNSRLPGRNPGQPCGCGHGDSGCLGCGTCRACAADPLAAYLEELAAVAGDAQPAVAAAAAAAVGGGGSEAELGMHDFDAAVHHAAAVGAVGADDHPRLIENAAEELALSEPARGIISRLLQQEARRKRQQALPADVPRLGSPAAAAIRYRSAIAGISAVDMYSELEQSRLAALPPAPVQLGHGKARATQVACGLHHTVVLLDSGKVYTFGSNQYGQLGVEEPLTKGTVCKVRIPERAVQVSAGSYHTAVITASGRVFTFGHNNHTQLGRPTAPKSSALTVTGCMPEAVPYIGMSYGCRAAWVRAAADQLYMYVEESIINPDMLMDCTVFANTTLIGITPTSTGTLPISYLLINRQKTACKTFQEDPDNYVPTADRTLCMDPAYDVIWSFDRRSLELERLSPLKPCNKGASLAGTTAISTTAVTPADEQCRCTNLLSPDLALPTVCGYEVSRAHAAVNLLASLDVLACHCSGQPVCKGLSHDGEEQIQASNQGRRYSKDDFSVVNRFDDQGGGWGYSGHSVEAVRFMVDTDVLIGGLGLFGGRGEYMAKIRLYELGLEGGERELDGKLIAETDDVPYECGARDKFALLFDDPILVHANYWYVAWARISGPSSDCGSSGQMSVTTDDQVIFKFRNSKKSNNGTDVNAGQIPQILYKLPASDWDLVQSSGSAAALRSAGAWSSTAAGVGGFPPVALSVAEKLSRQFSTAVSEDAFAALHLMLSHCWSRCRQFLANLRLGTLPTPDVLDVRRTIRIVVTSLRLLCTYICEVYPPPQAATGQLAAVVADGSSVSGAGTANIRQALPAVGSEKAGLVRHVYVAREFLSQMLVDCSSEIDRPTSMGMNSNEPIQASHAASRSREEQLALSRELTASVVQECHRMFTRCFHAFYPTERLQWACFSHLLEAVVGNEEHWKGTIYPKSIESAQLLTAVMEALCHPSVRLVNVLLLDGVRDCWTSLPSTTSCSTSTLLAESPLPMTPEQRSYQYPLLAGYMLQMMQTDSHTDNSPASAASGSSSASSSRRPHAALQFHDALAMLLHVVKGPVELVSRRCSRDYRHRPGHVVGIDGCGDGGNDDFDDVGHAEHARGRAAPYPATLVRSASSLLAALVGELAAIASKEGEDGIGALQHSLLSSPLRFNRTSPSAYWNTGNGSPDAVSVSVDQPGILLAGASIYGGGGGTYEYELEILDEEPAAAAGGAPSQRWRSLELARGAFTTSDCGHEGVLEIKLDKPVPMKPGTKYAIRLRNHGSRTLNGDGGQQRLVCSDGTVFSFSTCSLSSNGTNHTRGQIPQILYFNTRQEKDAAGGSKHGKQMTRERCVQHVLSIGSSIVHASCDLLAAFLSMPRDPSDGVLLSQLPLFSSLLPMVVAHSGPVAVQSPKSIAIMLELVHRLLPLVSSCVSLSPQSDEAGLNRVPASGGLTLPLETPATATGATVTSSSGTEHLMHHAIVESDHPYKPATVCQYKVVFPSSVLWMTVEFDPRCSTIQPEDILVVSVPERSGRCSCLDAAMWEADANGIVAPCTGLSCIGPTFTPLLRFHGKGWPHNALVLPGNQLLLSLETSSDYVKDEKANPWGFKCSVIGYEFPDPAVKEAGFGQLEREITLVGAACAAALVKQDLELPGCQLGTGEPSSAATTNTAKENVQKTMTAHSAVLAGGLDLCGIPTIGHALSGQLPPPRGHSNERGFLRDFINCVSGTSGGRLARWLQPESFVDPRHCSLLCHSRSGQVMGAEQLRRGWPAVFTVIVRDQYGNRVWAPSLKVDVTASHSSSRITEKDVKLIADQPHADAVYISPNLSHKYQVTGDDKGDMIHAITAMKCYQNHSFEELRFASSLTNSAHRLSAESAVIRSQGNGAYAACWTPAASGAYCIRVAVDGMDTGDAYYVDVQEAPLGATPPPSSKADPSRAVPEAGKMRKFVGKCSSGLRIRVAPSLQSEEIGLIRPQGVICFVEEVENSDGIWLKLTAESASEWCTNGYVSTTTAPSLASRSGAAWALQYNKHTAKTLLAPLASEASGNSNSGAAPKLPNGLVTQNVSSPRNSVFSGIAPTPAIPPAFALITKFIGGPGKYTVQHCGSAGHNVREKPDLQSVSIGQLALGTDVVAVGEVSNTDGVWLRLDLSQTAATSALLGCMDTASTDLQGGERPDAASDGGAAMVPPLPRLGWTLAYTPGVAVYLVRSSDDHGPSAISGNDTGSFQMATPASLEIESNAQLSSAATAKVPVTGAFGEPTMTHSRPSKSSAAGAAAATEIDSTITNQSQAAGDGGAATYRRLGSVAVVVAGAKPDAQIEGVGEPSIMAGGRCDDKMSAAVSSMMTSVSDKVPPEMRGLTVRELVKIMGESRLNANGDTPPVSPPGTPSSRRRSILAASAARGLPVELPLVATTTGGAPGYIAAGSSVQPPEHGPLGKANEDCLHGAIAVAPAPSSDAVPPLASVSVCAGAIPTMVITEPPPSTTAQQQHQQTDASLYGAAAQSKKAYTTATSAGDTWTAAHSGSGIQSNSVQLQKAQQHHQSSSSAAAAGAAACAVAGTAAATIALIPSVAESARAVFAAFLWHENIVHDAMACASFLKFHPDLPKEVPNGHKLLAGQAATRRSASAPNKNEKLQLPQSDGFAQAERKSPSRAAATSRLSSEGRTDALPTLQYLALFWNAVTSRLIGTAPTDAAGATAAVTPQARTQLPRAAPGSSARDQTAVPAPSLGADWPPKWPAADDIAAAAAEAAAEAATAAENNALALLDRMVRPSSVAALAAAAIVGMPGAAAAAPAAAAAAGAGGANANAGSVKCDLCDVFYPHPVTYHMKWSHPGCQQNSDSQGYNSRGEHCHGWAGKCGDGGYGSSTWYLLCGLCRDKYMQEKEAKMSKRDKKAGRASASAAAAAAAAGGGAATAASAVATGLASLADVSSLQHQHPQSLKSNALFLLELASSAGATTSGPTATTPCRPPSAGSFLPRVTEDSATATTTAAAVGSWHGSSSFTADGVMHVATFSRVPCRYLAQCGVAASDSAFAENLYPDDGGMWSASRGGISGGSAAAVYMADVTLPTQYRLARLSSDSHTHSMQDDGFATDCTTASHWDYQLAAGAAAAGQSDHGSDIITDSAADVSRGKPALVQRSLSDMGGVVGNGSIDEALPGSILQPMGSRRSDRQRKASGGGGDGGLSLLTAPSPSMSTLIDLARSEPGNLAAVIAQRPTIAFVMAQHDLAALRTAMHYVAGKAACRIHALKAFEWMLRNVSSTGSIHDVLWHFVTALTRPASKDASAGSTAKEEVPKKAVPAGNAAAASTMPDREEQDGVCEHPLTDVLLAGTLVLQPLQAALHSLLRIVADVMMYLPSGSPAQQMAIGCFCLRFQPNDHQFLHSSHVFSNISQILSKSDDEAPDDDTCSMVAPSANGIPGAPGSNGGMCQLDHSFVASLKDITHLASVTVSSRPGMIASLRDGSTETFWESGDEDKNRTKEIVAQLPAGCTVGSLYVYIDNGRDVQNKVSSVGVHCGRSSDTLTLAWSREVDGGHCGWVGCEVLAMAYGGAATGSQLLLKVELKGSSNSLRVRQLKVLGFSAADGSQPSTGPLLPSAATTGAADLVVPGARLLMSMTAQQKNCEAETLRVFRWLTSLVFGRLTGGSGAGSAAASADSNASSSAAMADDGPLLAPADKEADLKEHMVGILFSRSRLSHLQRLVCTHIVHGIRKETARIYDDWNARCLADETSAVAAAVGDSSSTSGGDKDSQLQQQGAGNAQSKQPTDSYCFELLSMVLALSGSRMGRAHLAEQADLLSDLLKLLHAASPRVRRQVLLLLRRILPDVSPTAFAKVVGASALPPHQLISVFALHGGNRHVVGAAAAADAAAGDSRSTCSSAEPFGALDVFLSCISKALAVQLKRKGLKSVHSITQAQCLKASVADGGRGQGCCWWMRGTMPDQTASGVALLLSDMSAGRLSEQWAAVTKAAVGEAILRLTKLRRDVGGSDVAYERLLARPALWLALAALCVVSPEHASMLSSASSAAVSGGPSQGASRSVGSIQQRAAGSGGSEPSDGSNSSGGCQQQQQQRLCTNHDDGLTAAMLWCAECASSLCADCDRFLHLSKAKRAHRRQIFREEEESIKIDLHEGCGRAKVFWFLAFADSRTLKAVVELRASHLDEVEAVTAIHAANAAAAASAGVCRFCSNPAVPLTVDGLPVCSEVACQEHSRRACLKVLPCGHSCCGVRDEQHCLPCLHGCDGEAAGRASGLRQDADDMCVICFSDALTAAPTIQLQCGHLYHLHCCEQLLQKRWKGPRISFTFCKCCICKAEIDHPALADLLKPIRALQEDVKRKALMRLNYDGLSSHAKVTTPGSAFFGDPLGLALDRYAYYVCFKCGKAYYGGQVRCQQNAAADEYDPSELVCGGCSDVARAQMCPKHGTDYLEYKCRYCCSVAVFFCFGTTHFCNLCHDDFQRITSLPKSQLPLCPAGPKAVQLQADECPLHVVHPPTGEEYALGCGICRHIHTF